jgi:hypothetical protein
LKLAHFLYLLIQYHALWPIPETTATLPSQFIFLEPIEMLIKSAPTTGDILQTKGVEKTKLGRGN